MKRTAQVLACVVLWTPGCSLEMSPLEPLVPQGAEPDAGEPDGGAADGGEPDGGGTSCDEVADCFDAIDCTVDECTQDGECAFVPDDLACAADERCDLHQGCVVWQCETAAECDDGLDCTVDTCDEEERTCRRQAVDGDGDGELDVACGGLDCDDDDPAVGPGAADPRDPEARDTNCDDVDGDRSAAIWVATDGNDEAAGTEDAPLASIAAATERAVASARELVIIGEGRYQGRVSVLAPMNLSGGWVRQDGQWSRVDAVRPEIVGDGVGVVVRDVAGLTILLRLSVDSGAAPGAGDSTYGLHVSRVTELHLDGVEIRTAAGAQGWTGGDGSAGATGDDGAGGNGGVTGCFMDNTGASGGAGGCGAAGQGGGGGDGLCGEASWGEGGDPGWPAADGAQSGRGGGGGQSGVVGGQVAGDGDPGGPGGDGRGGAAVGSWGAVVADRWVQRDGERGATGGSGAGGGGGGGGGGNYYNATYWSGGAGGGGGGGGCGGEGGVAGGGGGFSFGVFLLDSNLTAMGTSVQAGDGGNGGTGGDGGTGGNGGPGGTGGPPSMDRTTPGGRGGDGGPGGQGGGGSGGPGGWSCGVYRSGASTVTGLDGGAVSVGVAGPGGSGGQGGGGQRAADGGTGRAEPICESEPGN